MIIFVASTYFGIMLWWDYSMKNTYRLNCRDEYNKLYKETLWGRVDSIVKSNNIYYAFTYSENDSTGIGGTQRFSLSCSQSTKDYQIERWQYFKPKESKSFLIYSSLDTLYFKVKEDCE
jgi:hypothetical protein